MEMVYVMVMVIAMDPGHVLMVLFMAIIMVLAIAMNLLMFMVTPLTVVMILVILSSKQDIFLSLMVIIT